VDVHLFGGVLGALAVLAWMLGALPGACLVTALGNGCSRWLQCWLRLAAGRGSSLQLRSVGSF
jgi:hypothetical protein